MCSVKKGALRDFAKFSGKDLCPSIFFKKDVSQQSTTLLKSTSESV